MAALGMIEGMISSGMTMMFGNPSVIAIIILAAIGGFVMLQNTRLDLKVPILIGASILAAALSPIFIMLVVIFWSAIGFIALMRFITK